MARELKLYKGKYYQGSLSDEQAEMLLMLINEYDAVSSLRHCITDVPEHIIHDIKKEAEEYEYKHGTLDGFKHSYYSEIGVGTLRDDQTIGVAFMYYAESALLSDEVGLGKTVQVAGLCNVLKEEFKKNGRNFRFCFLTEKTNVPQIRDKMIQFTGDFVYMLESGERLVVERYLELTRGNPTFSVVGSHSLLNNSDFLVNTAKNPFDLIILDESSIVKNKNDIYSNVKSLFKYHKRKILLNATPVELDIREMYNQLALLDDNFLPTVAEFTREFCKMKRGMIRYEVAGYKNQEKFREAVSLRYLARTRKELGAKYTNNLRKVIVVPMSPVQKQLEKKTTLYQMVGDYPTGVDRNVPFNEETTPKLAVLCKLLEEIIDIGETQALVYCRFVEAQERIKEILESYGYRVVVLNGKSPAKLREEIVRDFNQGAYDIMITNVLRGIDLTSCDNCILYTIDPNPQKMVQFEGRVTRDFNVEYKSVYLLVSMGKEKKFVEEKLKLRANASASFTKAGKSMVLEAITHGDNREMFDTI